MSFGVRDPWCHLKTKSDIHVPSKCMPCWFNLRNDLVKLINWPVLSSGQWVCAFGFPGTGNRKILHLHYAGQRERGQEYIGFDGKQCHGIRVRWPISAKLFYLSKRKPKCAFRQKIFSLTIFSQNLNFP